MLNISRPVGDGDDVLRKKSLLSDQKGKTQFKPKREYFEGTDSVARTVMSKCIQSIIVLDKLCRVLSVNRSGCFLMEYDNPYRIVGKNYIQLWPVAFQHLVKFAVGEAQRGSEGSFRASMPTGTGKTIWWDVHISPIRDNSNQTLQYLVMGTDITDRKELEARMDNFLSATSHELKTPLTSQKAFIQLLESEMLDTGFIQYLPYVRKISQQTDKLTKLVHDLLDGTKLEDGRLALSRKPFNLSKLFTDVLGDLSFISDTHRIAIVGPTDVEVVWDREKMSHVLMNLVSNAIKFSPHSSKIVIRAGRTNNLITVAVEDWGIGIAPEHQSKIFDRFYRVQDNAVATYPGLGLGLYIAKNFVEQHGGNMGVHSTKGKGTTVYFTLPMIA